MPKQAREPVQWEVPPLKMRTEENGWEKKKETRRGERQKKKKGQMRAWLCAFRIRTSITSSRGRPDRSRAGCRKVACGFIFHFPFLLLSHSCFFFHWHAAKAGWKVEAKRARRHRNYGVRSAPHRTLVPHTSVRDTIQCTHRNFRTLTIICCYPSPRPITVVKKPGFG